MKRKRNKEFWRLLGRAVIAWETIKKMEEYKKQNCITSKLKNV
jgi:hypothetical protein